MLTHVAKAILEKQVCFPKCEPLTFTAMWQPFFVPVADEHLAKLVRSGAALA